MQRISTATRFQDKFGPGKDGFRDGDPGLGTASTQLEALWFDNAQEEIANAIELEGLTLNPNDMTQLWQAIRGGYVQKAGDTMTGPLFVPVVSVTQAQVSGALYLAYDVYPTADSSWRMLRDDAAQLRMHQWRVDDVGPPASGYFDIFYEATGRREWTGNNDPPCG
jgi:hypothetical protein